MAASANPQPRLPPRASSTSRSASSTHPRTSPASQPTASVHPRASPTSQPTAFVHPRTSPTSRPTASVHIQSADPSRPTSSLGHDRGRRSANVTYASLAFREASQTAHRACSTNDHSSWGTLSSSRRRARLPFEDSDSDDRPLVHRLRRRAPNPSQDSGPSAVPHPSPRVATTTPIPSQADAPPNPPKVPTEPPLAQPSTLQQH
ncbi:putative uncharacterized protein DDB_G0290521 [Zingiber officinale]|uniref:putative uncharacterized protein DDB_G0290521 n=1 Tax=Zingiber officinale TaxID=94328 RepID=UPI001C4D714F|nr:putative uncharacterized protein DDB_G0290521 [Zingiber officinale]